VDKKNLRWSPAIPEKARKNLFAIQGDAFLRARWSRENRWDEAKTALRHEDYAKHCIFQPDMNLGNQQSRKFCLL